MSVNFSQYAPEFIEHCEENLTHDTARQREYAVREITEYFDAKNWDIPTEKPYKAVDRIKEYFEEPGTRNPNNVNISSVRQFLEFIANENDTRTGERLRDIKGMIQTSKFNENGKKQDRDISDKILNKDEYHSALEMASDEANLLLRVLYETGCKPGEAAALTPAHFDFREGDENTTVRIEKRFSEGKGIIDVSTSEKRDTLISDETSYELRSYIEENDIGEGERIFRNYRTLYRGIKDAFTQAQVRIEDGKTNVSPRWLRHTRGVLLAKEGYNRETIKNYLGIKTLHGVEKYMKFAKPTQPKKLF